MGAIRCATFLSAILLASVASGQEITLESVPPVVVKTVPEAGSVDVDAGTKEVRVTFSKVMRDKSWSWSNVGPGSTPKTTGDAHYLDDRKTCVLPVQLEPGKTYAFWINSERFRNFRDSDGRAAVPYLLVFKTKAQ